MVMSSTYHKRHIRNKRLIALTASTIILLSLTSCQNDTSDSKPETTQLTTTTSPFSVTAPPEENIEANENEYVQAPAFSINWGKTNLFNEKDYFNGDEMSYSIQITNASDLSCDCVVGMLCNGKIIPSKVNDGEYQFCTTVTATSESEENKIKISYIPYGKKGETVKMTIFAITYTNCPDINKFGLKYPFFADGPFLSSSQEIELTTDGGVFEEQNEHKIDVVPIHPDIEANFIEADENGNNIGNLLDETPQMIIFQNNDYNKIIDCLAKDKNNCIEFDIIICGKQDDFTLACWTDKGFLPVFDGNYTMEMSAPGRTEMSVYTLKIDLTDHPDVGAIKIFGTSSDIIVNRVESSPLVIMTEEKKNEYEEWAASFE